MKRFVLVLITAMMFLASCGEPAPAPVSGKVIDREFVAEHWEGGYDTRMVRKYQCAWWADSGDMFADEDDMFADDGCSDYECEMYGAWDSDCEKQTVSESYWNSHHHIEPDRYRLRLRACTTNDDGKEKCNEGWRDVTENEYVRHQSGDYYPETDEHANGG